MDNLTKTLRQAEGANLIFNKSGTLVYPPGFGKTYTGCLLIQMYQKANPNIKVGIITPNSVIQAQWNKHLVSLNIQNVRVRTISSLIDGYIGKRYKTDILIVDEVHKFMSEINYTFINGERICYQHIIGLTATPPIGELRGKLDRIAPIIDRITIPEAIGNKWISNYIEFNYGLDFTVQEQELYVQLSKPITETLDSFRDVHKLLNLPNVESPLALMNCCTNGYMYKEFNKTNNMWDTHRIDSMHMCNAVATTMGWNVNIDVSTERGRKLNHDWSPTAIKERCLNFRTVSRRRNDLINNNKVKLNAILEILTKFNNKRGIIFNQSTEFADKLTASINFKEPNSAICYHSNIESRFLYNTDGSVITTKAGVPKKFGKTTLKKLALEGMLTNKFKYLVTVMALDAGLDITNLNLAIITSGTINPLQDKQRKGRSFRINPFAEDEVVIIFNLYMKNFKHLDTDITSRDYVKLTKRQADSELPCIFIDSLDEIQYLYKI